MLPAIRLIVLENRNKENYVLKLVLEGKSKFKDNTNAYIELMGSTGDFSIPLGVFVSDALHPNYFYLSTEKDLVEKLLTGEANYSLKFQNPVENQFLEVKLNLF